MARITTTRDDAPAYLLRATRTRRAERARRRPEPGRAAVRCHGPALEPTDRALARARRNRAHRRAAPRHSPARRSRRGSCSCLSRSAARLARRLDVRLIRHGQTQGYISDGALTPLGRWQAHRKGQDLAKGMQGRRSRACIVHAPTARAEETAESRCAEGLRQALGRYGIGDVTVEEPGAVDAFRQLPDLVRRRARSTSRPPSRSTPTLLEGYERHGGGDRPGWMVEMDRIYRIQSAGGDPITHVADPADALRRAPVVRRAALLEGIVDEVDRGLRRDAAACSSARTPGPIRAVAGVGGRSRPGRAPQRRGRPHPGPWRPRARDRHLPGRGLEIDIPTTVTPSWV